jgi:hypothetical protein
MSIEQPAFDCPGSYVAPTPTNLRCSKCSRPLAVKDAVRTPTGYVCPYYVKARVATFYNATPLQHALVFGMTLVIGIIVGLGLQLVSGIPFLSIIILLAAAPAAGAGIAELVRRAFKGVRGQYFWAAATAGILLGAAVFVVLPLLFTLLNGRLPGLGTLLQLLGLGLLISTLIARMR